MVRDGVFEGLNHHLAFERFSHGYSNAERTVQFPLFKKTVPSKRYPLYELKLQDDSHNLKHLRRSTKHYNKTYFCC